MEIKIHVTSKESGVDIIKIIQRQLVSMREGVYLIARTALERMREYASDTYRPNTGTLANAIDITVYQESENLLSIGIGNVDRLNSEVVNEYGIPYWKLANDGGIVLKPTHGYFGEGNAPDKFLLGQGFEKFTHDSKSFPLTPQEPTRPLNYIEKTSADILNLQSIMRTGFRTFKVNLK